MDMSRVYRNMPLDRLKTLKAEKQYELSKLRRQYPSYFVMQEIRRLTHLEKQLSAEIQSRLDQLDLL